MVNGVEQNESKKLRVRIPCNQQSSCDIINNAWNISTGNGTAALRERNFFLTA